MNCIVTAGPTYEPLDEVRRFTNFSTGRLGTELANFLSARGHRVTLFLGEQATCRLEPEGPTARLFSTTEDLRGKLKSLSGGKMDAVFHAAAVSDFTFGRIFLESAPGKFSRLKASRKIPTRHGPLLAELVPTPKVISELRGWFPKALIIGWKFEADGNRATALRAARAQIKDCATDACVANGPACGRGFDLVTPRGGRHLAGRRSLYAALERLLCSA